MKKTQNSKLKTQNNGKKVVVAMSGGVDSSVAAALLRKQGFNVIGVFLKFWKDSGKSSSTENSCCNNEALFNARKVAKALKIPFYVLNASKEFKKEVVDYYIKEYDSGRTPNPCVVCNKFIKFGWLLDNAKKLGANFIATGHYARIMRKFPIFNFQFPNKSKIQNQKQYNDISLLKAKDKKKDQSYFLWQLSQDQLKHIIFPIGDLNKNKVRKIAKELNLPVAEKKDSQNICFVSNSNNQEFLKKYANKLTKSGNIVDKDGNIIGQHKGLVNYTIGQRQGVIDFSKHKIKNSNFYNKLEKSSIPAIFVVKLNVEKNELVVGLEADLFDKELFIENINLINSFDSHKLLFRAKIRYGHQGSDCKIQKINSRKIKVNFIKPQRAITPGQSVVFYDKDELIGGGTIKDQI